jgi:hypothetical protein
MAALANGKRKKFVGQTRGQQERIGQSSKEAHLGKEIGSHFAVAFAFAPFFEWSKAANPNKIKDKEKRGSGSRPLLAGSRHRTRIRATLARILIPDPNSDPLLRIRVPVLP